MSYALIQGFWEKTTPPYGNGYSPYYVEVRVTDNVKSCHVRTGVSGSPMVNTLDGYIVFDGEISSGTVIKKYRIVEGGENVDNVVAESINFTYNSNYGVSYVQIGAIAYTYSDQTYDFNHFAISPSPKLVARENTVNSVCEKARQYFGTIPSPIEGGRGEVIVEIMQNGETLTFFSNHYINSQSLFVTNDTIVTMEPKTIDWEILWQYYFSSVSNSGSILIDSDFEGQYKYTTSESISGKLLKYTGAQDLTAISDLTARTGNVQSITSFTDYDANDALPVRSGFERLVIAKKSSDIEMPFEIGFHWQIGQSMEGCLVKSDGTFMPWVSPYQPTGDYITISSYGFSTVPFSGTLKYYKVTHGTSNSGEWIELDSSQAQSVVTPNFIVFAIPD